MIVTKAKSYLLMTQHYNLYPNISSWLFKTKFEEMFFLLNYILRYTWAKYSLFSIWTDITMHVVPKKHISYFFRFFCKKNVPCGSVVLPIWTVSYQIIICKGLIKYSLLGTDYFDEKFCSDIISWSIISNVESDCRNISSNGVTYSVFKFLTNSVLSVAKGFMAYPNSWTVCADGH